MTVQRLLVLNGLGEPAFREAFVRPCDGGPRKTSLDAINRHGDANTIRLLRLRRVLREPADCFTGAQISQYPPGVWPLFGDRLVWCWQCLLEGFHSVLFSLQNLTDCPLHGAPLMPFLPCKHPVLHSNLGSTFKRPGHCQICGAVFLTERTARHVGHHHGRDLRLGQLSQWLLAVGQRCWSRIPGRLSWSGKPFIKPIESWQQSLRFSAPPLWWDRAPKPPNTVSCPWGVDVHRYGGSTPSTLAVVLPELGQANDATFKSMRRYVVHHVFANRREWMTRLAASSDADEINGWLFREPGARLALRVLLWWRACLGRASVRDWMNSPYSKGDSPQIPEGQGIRTAVDSVRDVDARALAWVADRLRVAAALLVWDSICEATYRRGDFGEPLYGVADRRLAPVWSSAVLATGELSLCADAPAQRCWNAARAIDRKALKALAQAGYEATVAAASAPCLWYDPETQGWSSADGPAPQSRRECRRHRLLHVSRTYFLVISRPGREPADFAARCLSLPVAARAATSREAVNGLRHAVGLYLRHCPG